MPYPTNAWRSRLRPASFRSARFHVEEGGQSGGRRVAGHEFPMRDQPLAEDMGRRARRFSVQAYVIGANYLTERDALLDALDAAGVGTLVHPTLGDQRVMVSGYTCSERRGQGGYAEVSIEFVEAGDAAALDGEEAPQAAIPSAASTASSAATKSLNRSLTKAQSSETIST